MANDIRILGLTPNILIVDDTPENLDVLTGMLEGEGYTIRPVTDGQTALRSMKMYRPDIILLDITMKGMDGFELCGIIKRDPLLREIPVIFISALQETQDKVKAFSTGGVDYITKPFHNEEVLVRVATHLRLRKLQIETEQHNQKLGQLVRQKIREILDSQMATIFAMAKLAESRDDDTGRHLERVQLLCRLLAERLGSMEEYADVITPQFIENIANASPLHDIGKVGIQDDILLKPARLTNEEFETMKTHAVIGAETLKLVHDRYSGNDFVAMGIDIARHHHERWDGKGYPDGLAGDRIPLCARIVAVVDSYDAMRSKRCYSTPRSHGEAMVEITRCGGSQFDPVITREFVRLSGRIAAECGRLRDGDRPSDREEAYET